MSKIIFQNNGLPKQEDFDGYGFGTRAFTSERARRLSEVMDRANREELNSLQETRNILASGLNAGLIEVLPDNPSPFSTALRKFIDDVGSTPRRIMIKGPNGTAKPEIAYLFHRNAVCKRGYIFRRLNCSLSTSAEDIQAAIKEAGEGTLYLHDVDLLQPDVQRALIKILACPRDRGGVQARVLSSVTNASMLLPFLKDRLAIGVFKVPPLADRKVGIEAMAKRLAQHAAEQNVRPVIEPDKKFLAMLCTHDWPANDYELANFMARHQILARAVGPNWYHKPEIASDGCVSGVFDRSALPTNLNHKEAREKFHTDYLRALITATSGQISNAALKAGVDRTLLSRWLKERGLVDEARRLRQG